MKILKKGLDLAKLLFLYTYKFQICVQQFHFVYFFFIFQFVFPFLRLLCVYASYVDILVSAFSGAAFHFVSELSESFSRISTPTGLARNRKQGIFKYSDTESSIQIERRSS